MEERLAREGRRRFFWRSWTKPEAFLRTTRRVRREGEGGEKGEDGWKGGRREKEGERREEVRQETASEERARDEGEI
jgi:hypothetical protein